MWGMVNLLAHTKSLNLKATFTTVPMQQKAMIVHSGQGGLKNIVMCTLFKLFAGIL